MPKMQLTALDGGKTESRCSRTGVRIDLLDARMDAAIEMSVEAALLAVHYGADPNEFVRTMKSTLGIRSPLSLAAVNSTFRQKQNYNPSKS